LRSSSHGFFSQFNSPEFSRTKIIVFLDSLHYFSQHQRGFQTSLSISSAELHQVQKGEMHEVHVAAFTLFRKFIDEVVSRMQQFKDDLLVSLPFSSFFVALKIEGVIYYY